MRLVYRTFSAVTLVAAVSLMLPAALRADDDPRVFLRLAQGIDMSFEEASQAVEAALADAGWNLLGVSDCGVPEDRCTFPARVFVAYTDAHRQRLLAYGNHAAYALPIRFALYADETGIGLGATNPANLFRTIVDEETEPGDWVDISTDIRTVAALAFPDHLASTEFGQERDNARIGRTFGIMAGGPFVEKFKDVLSRPAAGANPGAVAQEIFDGLASVPGEWEWGIRPVYVLDLPENDMAIVGVTGDYMEARSFDIVGDGGMDEREDMACPGIDHAAAYPIEVVVQIVDGELQIRMVDTMFRMKMFFEDAGKMAFARNMGMPGSIEDEVKDKIRAVLQ